MEFSVQIEKPSNILRKLTIRVPAQTVSTRLQRGLAEVARTAKLKGFRPGHVPMSVVKQFYGEDVRHRVFHDLIDESFRRAVVQEQLRAVGSPKIDTPDHKTGAGEHDHTLHEDKDLTFTATVEVLPELEVKGYTGLSLKREKVEVGEKDVDGIVQNLRDSQAQLVPVEGRAAKTGDHLDLSFDGGIVNGDTVEAREGMKGSRVVEIGSQSLIPGFEENLVGMKSGETKKFRLTFPADYHEASVANKEAEFTVVVNEVKEKKLPEMTEEFAKEMGYEGVADLRAKAKEFLTRERTQEADRKLRSDLLAALIEKNPFDVPAALVQAQTRALAQDVAQNLKNQGFNEQMVQEALSGELPNLQKKAESQVRSSLLLEAVGKKEKISLSADEISAEIAKIAVAMKVEEPKLREYYEKQPDKRDDLEYRLREDRTVQFLLNSAKVK